MGIAEKSDGQLYIYCILLYFFILHCGVNLSSSDNNATTYSSIFINKFVKLKIFNFDSLVVLMISLQRILKALGVIYKSDNNYSY